MNKLKTGLVVVAGFVVGVVTLRRVRKQRTTPRDEAQTAVREARQETEEAASHAAAATEHAFIAGEKAIEYAGEQLDAVTADAKKDEETALPKPVRRLRRVGKGWIRR